MSRFSLDVKQYIEDTIENYEDEVVYGADLSTILAEYTTTDGYWMYMEYDKAMLYLANNREDAAMVWDYMQENFGSVDINPFANPCRFMCSMLDYGIAAVFDNCDFINDNWDEEILLDGETIETILTQVESAPEI